MAKIVWPKVSIVIPTYNSKDFIKPCLDSIFKQDYPKNKIEVLVVDSVATTDNTREIASKYPVKIIPNPRKLAEPAKTLGYKHSTGEYFFYLDSDAEFVSKSLISDIIRPLVNNPELAGGFTRFLPGRHQTAYNRYLSYNQLQLWSMLAYLLPKIKDITIEKKKDYDVVKIDPKLCPPIGLCFYRKKFLDKVITKPDEFDYVDIAIPLQLAEIGHNKFVFVEKSGIYHRADSIVRQMFRLKRDVTVTYLPVIGKRKFNYIDFKSPRDILRVVAWVIWVNLLIPSLVVGIYKTIRYRDLAGMYELPSNLILTNYVVYLFLTDQNGRKLISNTFKGLLNK